MKKIKRLCSVMIVFALMLVVLPVSASTNDIFLEEEHAAYEFLRQHTNTNIQSPGYGLTQDRSSNEQMASISATGFSLSALAIGVENGYLSYEEGYQSALKTLQSLSQNVEHTNGFFYHFLDINSAKRYAQSEVSGIDTAILISNALFVGTYFQGDVMREAQAIYDRVDWNWYRKDNNRFYMGYYPESGFSGEWDSYAEQMMMYFLGAASTTHPIPDDMLYQLDSTLTTYDDFEAYHKSHVNALFAYQYSHAFFDMRNKVDKQGVDWFQNSRIATLISRQFSIDTRNIFKTHGPLTWGLTASDGPFGYQGNYGAQLTNPNDGTIAPCGAAGSAPFAPTYVKETLSNYRYIENLWGTYGFKDAFNLSGDGYIAEEYLSIDKGITLLMLSNERDGLIWNTMNKNKLVQKGMKLVGMREKDSSILADGDHESNLQSNATVALSQDASQGNKAFHLTSQNGNHEQLISIPIDYMDDVFAVDMKGQASNIIVTILDDTQTQRYVSPAQSIQSPDAYETLTFDLSSVPKEHVQTLRVSYEGDDILLDELRFENRETMVHNVSISQKPYVQGKSEVLFDTILHEDVAYYEYEWYVSSTIDGEYVVVSHDATFIPQASHANSFLKVKVTPISMAGKKGISGQVQKAMFIHPQMSEVTTQDKETILAHMGKTLDDTSESTFDVSQNWLDDSGVYSFSEAPLSATYEKGNQSWAYLYRPFTTKNIAKFKALHMNVTTDTPLILKFETLQNGSYVGIDEITIPSSGVYEWDLTMYEEMCKQVNRILLFAAPGQEQVNGNFQFHEFYFASESGEGESLYPNNVSDFIVHQYDQSENFSFHNGLFEKGDTYKIQEDEKGSNISYQKQLGMKTDFFRAFVQGDFANVNTMRFTIKGQAGTQLEISPNIVETQHLTLSGNEDIIELDMSLLDVNKKNQLSYIDFIIEPDSENAQGEIQLQKAELSRQKMQFTIEAVAGEHGSISDDGVHKVSIHDEKQYTMKAFLGYKIKDVFVDGVSIGAVEAYTFTQIQKHHRIEVVFEKLPFQPVLPDDFPEQPLQPPLHDVMIPPVLLTPQKDSPQTGDVTKNSGNSMLLVGSCIILSICAISKKLTKDNKKI